MLCSVVAGFENSLTMANSSLLLLVLLSRRVARAVFLVFFRRRWYWFRAVLKEVLSSGVLLERHFLSCCLQWRFWVLSSSVYQLGR